MIDTSELEDLRRDVGSTGSPLDKFRVLELNADYRPISYFPLSTLHWQKVMFWHVKGLNTGIPRFHPVEYYPDVFVRAGRTKVQLPSVVAHMEYLPPPDTVPLTKFNSFLRDDFTCQYTGEKYHPSELTWDHVVPRHAGGKTTWDNIVAAYRTINELKDNMSAAEFEKRHGYKLLRKPYRPSWGELYNKGKKYPPRYLHETWEDYLYWDSELES